MPWLTILVKLLPFIFQLVEVAEKMTDKKGAGAEKKAAVKTGVGAIIEGLTTVSTGGQLDTIKKVTPLVDAIVDPAIDFAADMLYGEIVEQELPEDDE